MVRANLACEAYIPCHKHCPFFTHHEDGCIVREIMTLTDKHWEHYKGNQKHIVTRRFGYVWRKPIGKF
jgi:hypothetical protein